MAMTLFSRGKYAEGPRLLADVGATSARLALEVAPGQFERIEVLDCEEHSSLEDAVRSYLRRVAVRGVSHAAIAIANPIDGDRVQMINRDWAFSIEAMRESLELSTLLVVNDFTALAMALPHISVADRIQIGGGAPHPNSVIGLLGPGTGLGVSGLIPTEDRWITLGSEGGHVGFSPADEREMAVLRYAWGKYPHVSAERLLSGPGLELCHEAIATWMGHKPEPIGAAEVMERSLAQSDPVCVETMDCFCAMLGTVAADLALTLGAMGGIFIGGGIMPRLGERLAETPFRRRFESKGRFSDYLARIPTYVIAAPYPAFLGVSAILSETLRGRADESHLIDQVRRMRLQLSRAELRVADLVIARPRSVLNDPVGEIARAADVSQPTVIRFCRSMGFQGLSDFKLRLASGLTGTVPVQHSEVKHGDSVPEIAAKVLNNTVSAILRFRDNLNVAAIERATELLRNARRIELFGMGNSAVVAQDGQHKFFRFRIPTSAFPDPGVQLMAASLLGPGDVVVAISGAGRYPEILAAADAALSGGAQVIAITASQSPLARKATVCIPVDHDEDSPDFIAMISRILHLLVIDVLAVSVALQRADLQQLNKWTALSDEEGRAAEWLHRISHMG